MTGLVGFPNPVNEKAARVVAGGVLLIAGVALATGWLWLLAPLAAGFWLRVLSGPRLSPLGQLATHVIAPRLGEPTLVAGPPKRFAQAIGALVTTVGAVLALGLGLDGAADALLGLMVLAAGLESIFALCIGCRLFVVGIRLGLVPPAICAECADLSLRREAGVEA